MARGYDRHAGLNTPTQQLLRKANEELSEHLPGGYFIQGSGGRGTATLSPWIGVFDPDETTTPQQGIYVVYLFAEDMSTVSLSVQQGITNLSNAIGGAAARTQLAEDAAAIQVMLGHAATGLDAEMHLSSTGTRQRGYEAGNIASISYATSSLPPERSLRSDLARILHVYELAISAKREFLSREGGHIGFGVLAEHRRRGHATEILRQSLVVARAVGIDRVLVTCDDDNVGSATVIERCGGVLTDRLDMGPDLAPLRHYWID
ncbi:MAG: GNAT family N-acetyltransferase [Acidimicrobiales bacterium]